MFRTYHSLAAIISVYSFVAFGFWFVHFFLMRKYGTDGRTEEVNKLASTKKLIAFEIFSYVALAGYIALAFPWIDLFWRQWFTHFTDGILFTYFGRMTVRQGNIYLLVLAVNAVVPYASVTLADMARQLRRGRVKFVHRGHFCAWMPEE